MPFQCFDLDDNSKHIGVCSLPYKTYDPIGTEHLFGDVSYVLVSIIIDGAGGRMYFRRVV